MNMIRTKSERAIALVIVLSFISLVSALVLAYFSSVTTELTVTKAAANSAEVRMLADTAVDLVVSQIREATSTLPKDAPLAWTSQPGMIRVFGRKAGGSYTASRKPLAYYKLYSSDKLVLTENLERFNAAEEWNGPAGFDKSPDLYTDLNKPVLVPERLSGQIIVGGARHRAIYPILDPTAVGVVEGIALGKRAGESSSVATPRYAGAYPVPPSYNPVSGANPAPMPVRWMYVLKDGTMAVPTSAVSGVSSFDAASPNRPTKENPIVGRIAFWTDDESSKVNINTASEGMYWDTPMTSSKADANEPYAGLGKFPPAANEFQRYPGHPFTTCLSPVFGKTFGMNFPGSSPINFADPIYVAFKNSMYTMIPRVGTGGSNAGQVPFNSLSPAILDRQRLYSSVDELFFTHAPITGTGANVRRGVNPRMTAALMQQVRFFLTANSRAPELNLFGRPRISIWPVSSDPTARSAKDNVFAFCSTIGKRAGAIGTEQFPFYFTRANSKSPTADYEDTTRNGRNKALYSYLQSLTSSPIPGFSTGAGVDTFLAKYPAPAGGASERDQILTEIFDYIRCTNLSDSSGTGGRPYTPIYSGNSSDYAGQVTPIQINDTRGFGRFPTVSEAVIVFTPAKRVANDTSGNDKMRAVLMLECFSPSYGYMGLKDTYAFQIASSDVTVSESGTGQTVPLFQSGAVNNVTTGVHHGMHGRYLAGHMGTAHTFYHAGARKTLDRTGSGVDSKYPFVSDWITYKSVTTAGAPKTFRLNAGTIVINVYGERSVGASTPIVQTLHFRFPGANLRFPTTTAPTTDPEFADRIGSPNPTQVQQTDAWIRNADSTAFKNHTTATDTVRSVEIKTDPRLVAARKTVRDELNANFYFGPAGADRAKWEGLGDPSSIKSVIHSLRMSIGQRYLTAVPTGVLVAKGSPGAWQVPEYRWDEVNQFGKARYKAGTLYAGDNQARMADLPEETVGALRVDRRPGDWDTGVSKMNDGAYINKADDGESSSTTIPYYLIADFFPPSSTTFSPNRIIPSPGWFGSLSTGVIRQRPWETLLFRPDIDNHYGAGNPPDHLFMDLFNMPVVEPYPISEPFSQAGKINMNYQIMPFSAYMKRDTAMRAVLRSEKMMCIPFNAPTQGKPEVAGGEGDGYGGTDFRHQIDEDVTLAFMERRWDDVTNPENQVFRSATEICDVALYPKANAFTFPSIPLATISDARNGKNMAAAWTSFWTDTYSLTGDNMRERPYARLYPRLTTKSNTYTVHYRVQTLTQGANSDPTKWDENTGTISADYRGSAMIERYLDPADTRFTAKPQSTGETFNPDKDSLEAAYRYRILSSKQFVP